ncbi:hypothetical protein HYDPIDRAFT_120575 [Hydnomerulius pinastri MD-312]|uniref:HTH psq-type domain-containing protein n=1 Tax=Hydnomerulius pinastri MD-312 TaxID=994086 RepID=A0A0C2PWL5_9AGAM|nr:hypothetical protein HYDPIDRAFT_120575 [Hydnomerulius pinastri MD-312]
MPGRRRHISDDVKRMVVRMNEQDELPSRAQIRDYTDVAESTQRRILALHNQTGEVSKKPV